MFRLCVIWSQEDCQPRVHTCQSSLSTPPFLRSTSVFNLKTANPYQIGRRLPTARARWQCSWQCSRRWGGGIDVGGDSAGQDLFDGTLPAGVELGGLGGGHGGGVEMIGGRKCGEGVEVGV